jgi:digeranylgeranylglycerophospholipid reductase
LNRLELDVAVVGGGPAGLIAAREAARRGLAVAVFEEDWAIGRPERCAGLYSVDGLRRLGIPTSGHHVQNRVRGAVFVSPSKHVFEVDAGRDVALVCNRERLDQLLAEQAVKAGAELYVNQRVTHASQDGGAVNLSTRDTEARASHLILAEGRSAHLASQLTPYPEMRKWLPIVQYVVSGHGMDPSMVYLFFTPYTQEYFGYLVPVDDELGKMGLASSKHPDKLLNRLVSEFTPRARVHGIMSHSIYLGPPLQRPRHGNVLLVGDVAGQVKATTGGGVVMGGLCGMAAAAHAAGEGAYEELAKPVIKELQRTYLLRRIVEKIPPKMLDTVFKAVRDSGFDKALAAEGDMDRHITTLAKTAKHISTLMFALHVIKGLVL